MPFTSLHRDNSGDLVSISCICTHMESSSYLTSSTFLFSSTVSKSFNLLKLVISPTETGETILLWLKLLMVLAIQS